MSNGLYCVITTIQQPTRCVRELATALKGVGGTLLALGDRKGPASYDVEGARLVTLAQQETLGFGMSRILPTGHYGRKNLGYLLAIRERANCIYETDDDNAPAANWRPRELTTQARSAAIAPWVNVYRLFTKHLIWPRGFPLERITDASTFDAGRLGSPGPFDAPIQQGLVNGAPDTDAVWRLVMDRPFDFDDAASVYLPKGSWCPFNSQSTWWWPEAYPLLYLPSHCSFRMTDIWRSFVAQRCLWELGRGVVFHAAEVVQDRNPHNLLRDFEAEISGYLGDDAIVKRLEGLSLKAGAANVGANLRICYEALVAGGYLPAIELPLVEAWLADLAAAVT